MTMRLKFLIISYLALGRYVRALPLTIAADQSASSDRTKINIIWTCLVTIFSCTWVAVHPNIPAPETKGIEIALRRLRLMVISLVAPEVVIVWAMRQWIAARKLAHEHKAYGWTRAHGYFALMGGFMFYNGDVADHTIQLQDLRPLLKKHEISITKEEIKDKGRGDAFSKGVVVVQTGWFILQCIARRIEHLPLTELELVTLAFAALNFATYGLWWYKPLNVQCPLRVYSRPEGGTDTYVHSPTTETKGAEDLKFEVTEGVEELKFEVTESAEELKFGVTDVIAAIYDAPAAIANSIYRGAGIIRKKLPAAIYKIAHALHEAITRAVKYVRTNSILSIIRSGTSACICGVTYPIWLLARLVGAEEEMKPSAKQVPTFYAGELTEYENWLANCAGLAVATVFGGIHCFAWPFQFPSQAELWLWRMSSLTITCVPLTLFMLAWVGEGLRVPLSLRWLPTTIYSGGVLLYMLARTILLILPFAALRSLPPEAYQTVSWTDFIPHV